MRTAITVHDAEELELSTPDNRAVAEALVEWAEQPHPDDELSPRELLTRAGEQLELADDGDGALALYRRAVAAAGDALIDPRAHVISLLLQRGEQAAALDLDHEVRQSRPDQVTTYEYLGEVWADHDEPQRALGWFTRGILRHEQGPPFSDTDLAMLSLARWQLRKPLGHEPDDYDLIGMGLQRRMQQRTEQHDSSG